MPGICPAALLTGSAATKLLEESNDVLTELKNVVNITTLSMTDKERMDVVERCYSKMKRYRNLVSYYTNKNISVSYLRAKKKNDLDRIMGLYGNMNERYSHKTKKCAKFCIYLPEYLLSPRNIYSFATAKKIK